MTESQFGDLFDRGKDACWKVVKSMNDRLAVLEGRLKQNSNNSHFPPSSDLISGRRS